MLNPFTYFNRIRLLFGVLLFIVWTNVVVKPLQGHSYHIYEVFLAALVFAIVWFILSHYNALKWILIFGIGVVLIRNSVDFGRYFFYCLSGFILFRYLINENG